MRLSHTERLLEVAAQETRERIRRDQEKVSRQVLPFLSYLGEHLFDPDLTVEGIKRATGIRDNALPVLFHQELGMPPRVYLSECRLEIAARLLRTTKLQAWKIAQLVGYSGLPVFSRAFAAWAGQRPSVYRRKLSGETAPASSVPDEWCRARFWRRVWSGELADEEAVPLVRHLLSRYGDLLPEPQSPATGVEIVVDGEEYERFRAESLWKRIEKLPWPEQREYVRRQVRFRSGAMFHLLREKSRTVGRNDRQEGIRLAELALESLEGSAEPLGKHFPPLRVRAWIGIGNAHRLADKLPTAEQAFAEAESQLGQLEVPRDPLIEAELCHHQASLKLFQRRFRAALKLQDQALSLYRVSAESVPLARALLQRASIHAYAGGAEDALPDLREALSSIEAEGQSDLELSAETALATIHVDRGCYEEAREPLKRAKRLAQELGHRLAWCQMQWLEGRLYLGREEFEAATVLIQEARQGFLELGETNHAAVVAIDLAILYVQQGHATEAVSLLLEVIPVFDAGRIHREPVLAVQLLGQAIEQEQGMLALLLRVRSGLSSSGLDHHFHD